MILIKIYGNGLGSKLMYGSCGISSKHKRIGRIRTCSDFKLTKAYIENERSGCSFENSWMSVDSMVTRHGRPVLFALDGFALKMLSLDLSSIDNFVE